MKKLMNILFLSCKKSTLLIEKRQGFSLSVIEKIQVKMHTSMCSACHSYQKQSLLINKAVASWFSNSPIIQKKLSKEAKERIIDKLEKA